MKTAPCFWPLLKNEIALGWHGSAVGKGLLATSMLFLAGVLPLPLLFGHGMGDGDLGTLFHSGILVVFACLFLVGVTICLSLVIPAVKEALVQGMESQITTDLGAFEFLFTRAVDRRKVMRAKTVAVFMLTVLPLFASACVSFFAPPTRFEAHAIDRGAILYSGWVLWSGALGFFLLQGYIVGIAKWVRSDNLWTLWFPFAPLLLGLATVLIREHWMIVSREDLFQKSYTLFAKSPVLTTLATLVIAFALQVWSERRFAKLEIL